MHAHGVEGEQFLRLILLEECVEILRCPALPQILLQRGDAGIIKVGVEQLLPMLDETLWCARVSETETD